MTERRCMAYHAERRVYCGLPLPGWEFEHDGPHGWDYEAGCSSVVKRSDFEGDLEARGLSHLNDRMRAFEAKRDASDEERRG